MKRPSVDELTRLAFCWAEQDRASLADCWPAGSPEKAKVEEEMKWLRAYRLNRWGRTNLEVQVNRAKSVSIHDGKEGKA